MPGRLKSVKLQTESDVYRFLAKVINMLNRDEIDPNKASRLGYLCNLLVGGLRRNDLEDRLAEIERILKANGKS
ncbi:MAG TPA: hypothetical protein VGD14_14500 [bacterium]|jgi:hypothetical protein